MAADSTAGETNFPNLVTVGEAGWEQTVVKSELPVVVNFWAPGCPHSEKLGPTFELLSHRFIGRMRFARVNVAENKGLAVRYGVVSVPSLMYFYEGRPYFSVIGEAPRHQLESEMNHILAQNKRCISRSSPWTA